MTAPMQENQAQDTQNAQQISNKELNFRNLEASYQRKLEHEMSLRMEAEKRLQQASQASQKDDEDDSEPYIDNKKLDKRLAKFGEQTQRQTQTEIDRAVKTALSEERKQNWIKNNPDFYSTLQLADKFAAHDPELAETILEMPEGFERQKLVYKNIKALGLDKPVVPQSSIQDKVDANRRNPGYQPSSQGSSPYASQGDFSQAGQKAAYEKMQALLSNLRM